MLNLSYPRDQSVNDIENRSFILKFPSTDYIINDARLITDPLISKTGVATSFRNSRVGPGA